MINNYQDRNYLIDREYKDDEKEEKNHSFFSTVAGKIAIGASSAVVLGALVVGGIIFLGKKDDQSVVEAETVESIVNVDVLRGYMKDAAVAGKAGKSDYERETYRESDSERIQKLAAEAEMGETAVTEETTSSYVEETIDEAETKASVQIPNGKADCYSDKISDWTEEAREREEARKAEEEAKKQEEAAKAEAEAENAGKLATSKKPAEDTADTSAEDGVVSGLVTLSMTCTKQEMEGQPFYLYPTWKEERTFGYLLYSPMRAWDVNLSKKNRVEVTFEENGEATLELEAGRWILTDEEGLTAEELYVFDITEEQVRDYGTVSIGIQHHPSQFKDASGNSFTIFSDGTVEGCYVDKDDHKKEYSAKFEIISNEYTLEGEGQLFRTEHWTVTVKCIKVDADQEADVPFVQGHEYTLSGDRIFGDFWMDSEAGLINWDFVILDEEGNEIGYSLKI